MDDKLVDITDGGAAPCVNGGLLDAVFDAICDIVLVLDTGGRIIKFNPYLESLSGYGLDEVRGMDWFEIFLPEADRAAAKELFLKTIDKTIDKPIDGAVEDACAAGIITNIVTKDGSIRFVEWRQSALMDDRGAVIGLAVVGRDVTERRRAEQALIENLETLKSIIDNSTAVIYLKDSEGRYLLINRRFEELFNITKERILGLTDFHIFPKEAAAQFRQNDLRVIESLTTIQSEETVPHADGLHTYISIKFPVFDSRHNAYGVCGISTDITARKIIEQELHEKTKEFSRLNKSLEKRVAREIEKQRKKDQMLIHQSKLAAMGEMIGAIAHQWRQPLNAIGLLVQDAEDAFDFGEIDREYIVDMVQKTMEQVQYMSHTIDDFKNFFRTSKMKKEFNVAVTVREVLNILDAQLRNDFIKVGVDIDAGGPYVLTNFKNEFMQALLNIISNARDAILERAVKGELGLEDGRIAIKLVRRGGWFVTSVADNGGGIPEKIKDRIFEPYFSSKDAGKGTGIGLYMSKIIIEKNMGGKLYTHNEGEGAVFTIELEAEGVGGGVD